MLAAGPVLEHPIRQGQMCSFLSFPSDGDSSGIRGSKGQSPREERENLVRETKK